MSARTTYSKTEDRFGYRCPTCGHDRNSWSMGETNADWQAGHDSRLHGGLKVGQGITQRLWTDSRPYVVTAVHPNGKSATVALLNHPEKPDTRPVDGPFPVVSHRYTTAEMMALCDMDATLKVTLRKDGMWRFAGTPTSQSGSALHLDGAVLAIDYRV